MRGAHLTFGRRGVTHTVGIPGAGIYYTSRVGCHSGFHSAHIEKPIDLQSQARANTVAILALLALAIFMVLVIAIIVGWAIGH